jgi:hypothetical protein
MTDFRKKIQISSFMKNCQLGAELFRADAKRGGHTDMKKRIHAFRNDANAPKRQISLCNLP